MTNPSDIAHQFLDNFSKGLKQRDINAVVALFNNDCYWRDLVSFTWNIKTLESKLEVSQMLAAQLDAVAPTNWRLDPNQVVVEVDGVIEAWFNFDTATARGYGLVRLREGKVWTLLTTMTELKGHEESTRNKRPLGALHGAGKRRPTWKELRHSEAKRLGYSEQPYCVIVGGGQGGIGLGARMRQLSIPTIIVEKNEKPGDSWRKRYKSLCLHDPVWYDHLPYIKFPENWPVFSPKDKIGDWLEMYTKVMELNYWTKTVCQSAQFNASTGRWRIKVVRDDEPIILEPTQLVLATGMSGKANIPQFPGQDRFQGEQHHSSQHPGPDNYQGKKVVVIGSNNSAHDISAALWENDVDVTMVQRSPTVVVRSDPLMEIALGGLYSEEAVANGMTTEKADLVFASQPYKIMHESQIPLYDQMRERDKDFYRRLTKTGFMLGWGADKSGLFMIYLRRGSGYYIDIGASDLVANGDIKLKTGQVECLTENTVVLVDGTEIAADVVVYATGYGSMNGWAADLISQEVADRVGKCWGLGSDTPKDPGPWEGELRNMWKPTQQPNLWFHGGNLHQSRHYSQFLSLQLKARMEGIDGPVYGLQSVHHKS